MMSSAPSCSDEFSCFIQQICSKLTSQYTNEPSYMVFIETLKVVTAMCSFFVAYMILSQKKIQHHPGYLVALISLFQGGFIFAYN